MLRPIGRLLAGGRIAVDAAREGGGRGARLCRGPAAAALAVALAAAIAAPGEARAAAPEKRVALVVGNSAYRNTSMLENPSRDARAVAEKLQKLGFEVIEGYDLDKPQMDQKIHAFAKQVRGADIGMFFYAGHGMQVNGENYLVPVDAVFEDPSDLEFRAVSMDAVTQQMKYDVAVRVVVLDACRDNPLSRSLARSLSAVTRSAKVADGLAKIDIGGEGGEGTAIIYATSPDEVAYDGDASAHSPFTKAFLEQIEAPDTDIQVVMSRVTGQVLESTKNLQRPWINASLTGEVFLNPQTTRVASLDPAVSFAPAAETVPQAALDVTAASASRSGDDAGSLARETALYGLARDSGQRADYEAYLETFPDGLYAANARKQISRLPAHAGGTVVASLGNAGTTPQPGTFQSGALQAGLPAAVPGGQGLAATISGEGTEVILGLDRTRRKEVQLRLNLAGFDTGTPDGVFGPNTRNAIIAWQTARNAHVSGYLNRPQYELLVAQTQAALAAYTPPAPPKARTIAPQRQKSYAEPRQRAKPRVVRRVSPRRSGGDPAAAAFFGGLVGGVIGGAIGR
ncbi:caspase family protein [Jiella avicenniae]|uniref:Caspase family protein n=1 Tax=Jiella avicenniae TaxID=2907202 RepID=A0A9X1T667_9HYPH|nr:caspase family protein [Jiella avicenniae]MCE7030311.1 caspase family protein [Jiella avicenniae]